MANISYTLDKRLIIVQSILQGKYGEYDADLILDTGASLTIIDPSVIEELGYTADDKSAPSIVKSPIGKEKGFRIHLHALECLGQRIENFEIACHSLGLQHVDGLLGMNFLEKYNFCIYPDKQIIKI